MYFFLTIYIFFVCIHKIKLTTHVKKDPSENIDKKSYTVDNFYYHLLYSNYQCQEHKSKASPLESHCSKSPVDLRRQVVCGLRWCWTRNTKWINQSDVWNVRRDAARAVRQKPIHLPLSAHITSQRQVKQRRAEGRSPQLTLYFLRPRLCGSSGSPAYEWRSGMKEEKKSPKNSPGSFLYFGFRERERRKWFSVFWAY